MIGKEAVAQTTLDPKGTVLAEGELWTAIAEDSKIEPGEEVTIIKVEGLKLWVTKKSKEKEEK
jgi:membrane-bound serine protease (ClpP class)